VRWCFLVWNWNCWYVGI